MKHRLYVHSSGSAVASVEGSIDIDSIRVEVKPWGSLMVEYVTMEGGCLWGTIVATNWRNERKVTVERGGATIDIWVNGQAAVEDGGAA